MIQLRLMAYTWLQEANFKPSIHIGSYCKTHACKRGMRIALISVSINNDFSLPSKQSLNEIRAITKIKCRNLTKLQYLNFFLDDMYARWVDMPGMMMMIYSYFCAHGRLNGPVMKQSQRWNTLQMCQHRDSNMGGSDLWSKMLPLDHEGAGEVYI